MKWSDDDLDLALRDLRDEEIPVGAVRARVMAQVSRRRSIRWWQWAWVPALAGALFVLAPKESPVEPLPLVARAPGGAGFGGSCRGCEEAGGGESSGEGIGECPGAGE